MNLSQLNLQHSRYFLVIGVSIILMTGMIIPPTISLDVFAQNTSNGINEEIEDIVKKVASTNPDIKADNLRALLSALPETSIKTLGEEKAKEEIHQINLQVTYYPGGIVAQSLDKLSQQLVSSTDSNIVPTVNQILQEKSQVKDISQSLVNTAVKSTTTSNQKSQEINQFIDKSSQIVSNEGNSPPALAESVLKQFYLQTAKTKGTDLADESMKEITNTLTKQPKGDLTKALVDLVKIFENDSGGNSQILNVIKQVVNDAVTKDKTSNTGQGKDAKTVIVKKIIETPKPKPTNKASNDPSIKSTIPSQTSKDPIKSTIPSQPSTDPNFIRLPPNTKFLPTLDGTFSTHVLLPTGMIATFPISAIKTGPDGSLGIVLPTTKISNVPQSGFSDLGKLQGITNDLPADLSSFSVPDNVIPNSAITTSTLPGESPEPPVDDAASTAATTEIPSEPKSVVGDAASTAATTEIPSEPKSVVGDAASTAATTEIPSEPIIDDAAATALEIPSEPKSIVDDTAITDVSSESEDNDVNQVKAEEEEEEESEDNDVNQVKAEEEEEEESEDNDVNQVKAEEEEEEESEDNDVNQVKAEEEEEEESEDNDVNQINQVKAEEEEYEEPEEEFEEPEEEYEEESEKEYEEPEEDNSGYW